MGVSIMVNGNDHDNVQDLLQLCFAVRTSVLTKVIGSMTEMEKAHYEAHRRCDSITPDGLDVFHTQGVINFYLFGIPTRLYKMAMWHLTEAVRSFGATHQDAFINKSQMFGADTIRLPITEMTLEADPCPEMHISYTSAELIMNALGMSQHAVFSGEGESIMGWSDVPVSDVIMAASSFVAHDDLLQSNQVENNPGQCTFISQGYDVERINSLRDGLLSIAQWAQRHGFQTLRVF